MSFGIQQVPDASDAIKAYLPPNSHMQRSGGSMGWILMSDDPLDVQVQPITQAVQNPAYPLAGVDAKGQILSCQTLT